MRAAETGAAVWRWLSASDEHGAIFLSLAASHRASDRLVDLHDQLLVARAAVMRSDDETWRRFRRRFGIVDLAWKIEHSCGLNGPHPGLHAILLTDRQWEAEDAQGAEAWLLLRFRAELAAAGFTGRLSAERGIDVRPVDDVHGAAKYLSKWAVGAELVSEHSKLGRVETSLPYAAIPSVLAQELGRRDPHRAAGRDRQVRRLVDGWGDYVRLATTDKRKWWRGFRKLKALVPEIEGLTRPAEIIAACTELLPEELRPAKAESVETEDDDDEGVRLTVTTEVWGAAQRAWWRGEAPYVWVVHRRRLVDPHAPPIPLELAIVWMAEDLGIDAAAEAVAELAGAELVGDENGLVVCFEPRTDRSVS